MFVGFDEMSRLEDRQVSVVGGGPVGIALALACEEFGLSVLLLESGLERPSAFQASLSEGHEIDPARHAGPGVAICRNLGGTSRWWGGRCVALDAIDFEPRRYVEEGGWPIRSSDLEPWYEQASEFFQLGQPHFRASNSAITLDGVDFDNVERWAPHVDIAAIHRSRLEASKNITVVVGATVTAIELSEDGRTVVRLKVAGRQGAAEHLPRRVVLACGGLETTRLLLELQRHRPDAVGGSGGPLGRYYMGHVSGRISDLVLDRTGLTGAFDFFRDGPAFVRRRLTLPAAVQRREELLNIAFWADNPPFHATEHGSGALSLVWLALAFPSLGRRLVSEGVRLAHVGPRPHRWMQHLRNVVRQPLALSEDLRQILVSRFLSKPRKPGFLVRSASGRYALHYHSEQAPNRDSRITLSSRQDVLGVPFLKIDLRFGSRDAESVVRAHEHLDRALRQSGIGRLDYYEAPDRRLDRVLSQASDGFHQIGTTRMGTDPKLSVVNSECRVHGIDNLFVASSSVFPTSGQANPTFAAVALAIRLARHLGTTWRIAPGGTLHSLEAAGQGNGCPLRRSEFQKRSSTLSISE